MGFGCLSANPVGFSSRDAEARRHLTCTVYAVRDTIKAR
jgi:hypothetical protein